MRNVERRLAATSQEIRSLRSELGVLREQLVFQREVMEDARVRALVAETPLADRELRVAAEDHRRIERSVEEAERRLAELGAEQDRLLAGMLGAS